MKSISVKVPNVGESVTTAIIKQVFDQNYIQKGQIIAVIETDKISTEIESDHSGAIEIMCSVDQEVNIGQEIAKINTDDVQMDNNKVAKSNSCQPASSKSNLGAREESKGTESEYKAAEEDTECNKERLEVDVEYLLGLVEANSNPAEVNLSPGVEAVLSQNKIDPINIIGTWKGGRITESDISDKASRFYIEDKNTIRPTKDLVNISAMRKAVASNLKNAVADKVPTSTFNQINMTKARAIAKENKLSLVGLFVKAVNIALREFPQCASYIQGDNQIFSDIDSISFAVAMPGGGIITPTLKHCKSKSIRDISSEISDILESICKSACDLSGGCITITNGGVFGSMLSTPALPFRHHSAILGLHKIEKRPICCDDGSIVAADLMYVALTYDHAVIDGKDAVLFLDRIKELIENLELMLIVI